MMTASRMLKKCAQRPSETASVRRRPTLTATISSPAILHSPAASSQGRPPRTGHSLYDQLMKSHDRVRPRRG